MGEPAGAGAGEAQAVAGTARAADTARPRTLRRTRIRLKGVRVLPSLWGAWCGGRRKYPVAHPARATVRAPADPVRPLARHPVPRAVRHGGERGRCARPCGGRSPYSAYRDPGRGGTRGAPARTRRGGTAMAGAQPTPAEEAREAAVEAALGALGPDTVVVVNSGSPVELPRREEVAAVLLGWFPGQEGGAALADVLTGAHEPGGRLPTTWGSLADAPVTRVVPAGGELPYTEDVFIGYRAWEKAGRTPSYPFGHGLGYTDWAYESLVVDGGTARVRVRNTGERAGREVVQVYVAPAGPGPERPARRLAGFAPVEAGPGESVEAVVELPARAFEVWDETAGRWECVKGSYEITAARSIADHRLTAPINV
ncbi:glycoside hydrolase family 3 C-terminal domain-containing protein [Streptomyces sp. NPDC018347]|uniref:glycoside hydrolase family 3 C-terminal domain-containing protein n=1 Tax=Streptomyces sp. NPDC018347 TaxID=3157193 RepID=UPI00340FFBF7